MKDVQGKVAFIAARGYSESLRIALAGSGAGVSVLCPGLVKTGMIQTGAPSCRRRRLARTVPRRSESRPTCLTPRSSRS